MEDEPTDQISRRDFMKLTGSAALTMAAGGGLFGFPTVLARSSEAARGRIR